MKKVYDTAIIGGGAAGLFCAALLSGKVKDIVIFDKNQRLGKKLSQTGNGQGNITNKNISLSRYHGNTQMIDAVLQTGSLNELLRFLQSLGGIFTESENGRIYPASMQAASVTDLLREKVEKNAQIKLSCEVLDIYKDKDIFIIKHSGGQTYAKAVILATGGKAGKHFGTDGSAYRLAQKFGHKLTPLFPSLVRLKTKPELIRGLRGVKINALVKALINGGCVFQTEGDILFTESGISGNTVFEISAYLTDKDNAAAEINFAHTIKRDDLTLAFQKKIENGGTADMLMCGIINRQLSRLILKKAGIDHLSDIKSLAAHLNKIADLCYCYTFPIVGTDGFDSAQVTKGGIDGADIDNSTLMSKLCKNLYFAGEVLDADGDCGGFNIQWAFSSAKCVCDNILKTLDRQ